MEKGIGYTNESWQMNQLLRNYKLSKEGNVTVQRSIKGWKVDLSSMGSLALHSENRPYPSLRVNSDITEICCISMKLYELYELIPRYFLMIRFVYCLSCFSTRELGKSDKLFDLGLEEGSGVLPVLWESYFPHWTSRVDYPGYPRCAN